MKEIDKKLEKVYLRLHNFIYRKCGFVFPITKRKSTVNTLLHLGRTSAMYELGIHNDMVLSKIKNDITSTFDPHSVYSVIGGISISNIKDAKKLITACKATDLSSGYTKKMKVTNGRVFGFVTKTTKLPAFHIWLEYDGMEMERIIIPQNPFKHHINGNYSKYAIKAQQGDQISWIIDAKTEDFKEKWVASIINSIIEDMNPDKNENDLPKGLDQETLSLLHMDEPINQLKEVII